DRPGLESVCVALSRSVLQMLSGNPLLFLIRPCIRESVSDKTPCGKDAAMMLPTLGALAHRVGGELQGDGSLPIRGVAALDQAGPNEMTFAGDEKHLRLLAESRAGACLVGRGDRDSTLVKSVRAAIVFVDDPQDAFIALLREFRSEPGRPKVGISPKAHISPSAKIGDDCNVFPGVFIDEDVVIGSRCDLYPGVYV